jgi:hypothetical protein
LSSTRCCNNASLAPSPIRLGIAFGEVDPPGTRCPQRVGLSKCATPPKICPFGEQISSRWNALSSTRWLQQCEFGAFADPARHRLRRSRSHLERVVLNALAKQCATPPNVCAFGEQIPAKWNALSSTRCCNNASLAPSPIRLGFAFGEVDPPGTRCPQRVG